MACPELPHAARTLDGVPPTERYRSFGTSPRDLDYTENSLLCLLVVFVLLFEGRLDWKKAAVLVFLSVGSEVVINQFGYPWQELYGHLLGAIPRAMVVLSGFPITLIPW